jgi:parallel beta-helix repeat protein
MKKINFCSKEKIIIGILLAFIILEGFLVLASPDTLIPDPITKHSVKVIQIPNNLRTPQKSSLSPQAECLTTPTDGCTVSSSTTFNLATYTITGISVVGNNVILDCNGATLLGSNSYTGIFVNGTNATIKNCKIFNYGTGILLKGINVTISNNTLDNTTYSIFTDYNQSYEPKNSLDYVNIDKNNVYNIQSGMYISTGKHVTISNNVLENNSYVSNAPIESIYINTFNGYSGSVNILNNNLKNNLRGIQVHRDYTYNNTKLLYPPLVNVFNNTLSFNAVPFTPGIFLFQIYQANVSNNIIINASTAGIELDNASQISIMNNDISFIKKSSNNQYGYGIMSNTLNSYDVDIEKNILSNNAKAGIFLTSLPAFGNITVAYNTLNANGQVGIWLTDVGGNNSIYNNIVTGHNSHGIYADSFYGSGAVMDKSSFFNNTVTQSGQAGIYIVKSANGNTVYDNILRNNQYGMALSSNNNNAVYKNNITLNSNSGLYFFNTTSNKIFLNNIFSNSQTQVYGDVAQEVSYQQQGNYWGRTSGKCFIAGQDSNRIDINDSYAYCNTAPSVSVFIPIPNTGWYFFGSNGRPRNTSITKVLGGIIGNPSNPNFSIVQYYLNGTRKQYDPLLPLSSPLNSLKDILPWYGYWIKINSVPSGGDFLMTSDKVIGSSPLALNVNQHWIGYWCNYNKPTASALISLTGNYTNIKTYENGAWKTYDPALPQFSDLLEMKPGNAYLIKMNATDSLDYVC